MKINAGKSGIMRTTQKKVKIKGIKNELDIPEVNWYKYLGIMINQRVEIREHTLNMRLIDGRLIKKIKILKPTFVSVKSRFLLLMTIIKSMFCYWAHALWHFNKKYSKDCLSVIYRLVKCLLNLKGYPKKKNVFNTIGIENWGDEWINALEKIKHGENRGWLYSGMNNRKVEELTLKVIKLKIGWLFNWRTSEPKCRWDGRFEPNHVICDCIKTRLWRIKWNHRWRCVNWRGIVENLLSNINEESINEKIITIINSATDEVWKLYIEN